MYAIVAQLDRAFGSDPEGQRFESSRSHQEKPEHICVLVFLFSVRREDSNRAAAHSAASKATVRLCLARGSQRVGMSNNRLRFTVRREDSNSNDDDRSQRLKQGGVVGAAFWFFKALSRGCGKISKRNPSGPAQQGKQSAQPVGMSNKRTTVHPGEMELALFVFHPDAVQSVCDKGLPV